MFGRAACGDSGSGVDDAAGVGASILLDARESGGANGGGRAVSELENARFRQLSLTSDKRNDGACYVR